MVKEKSGGNHAPSKDLPQIRRVYDGESWGIFYLPIDDFEAELSELRALKIYTYKQVSNKRNEF